MTEQQRSSTRPLGFTTQPLGHEREVLSGSTSHPFKTYLEQQRLSLAAASQITGVHISTLWRVCQKLPVSGDNAAKIRERLRSAARPYIGPIAVVEAPEPEISTSSEVEERIHKIVVGDIATIYEGKDQDEAQKTFQAAMDTFADRIQHIVEKAPDTVIMQH